MTIDWTQIILYILAAVGTILGSIITAFVIPWIKAKIAAIKDENLRKALEQSLALATTTVETIVNSLSQTLVKEYVNKGTWDDETKAIVLETAITQIKAALTSEQAAAIVSQTQLTIDEWLKTQIEAFILVYKPNN